MHHPVYSQQQQHPYASQPQQPYVQQQSYGQQTPYNPYAQVPDSRASQQPAGPSNGGQFPVMDPFNSLASSMLQQSGSNYLERGQEFVKSRMLINSSSLHYHFDIDNEYVRNKLLMLLVPFLRRWSYTRSKEQIAGGHPFKSPRQDINAPDLYIPVLALYTYCILGSITLVAKGRWSTDAMYGLVSSGLTAWTAHVLLLKAGLWLLGVPSAVPILEALCYTGYPFVLVCINNAVIALLGSWSFYIAWLYGSLCMATFTVRTMKSVLFRDTRQYSASSSTHNYMLLFLAVCQFPLTFWLTVRP